MRRRLIRARLQSAFANIHSFGSEDRPNQIVILEPGDLLVAFNKQIEAFVSCVKETEFAEFLPFLQSRDDTEFFCALLLNQDVKTRLKTLKSIEPDLEVGRFFHWFTPFRKLAAGSGNLLECLLEWQTWLDAKTWIDRWRVYQANCLKAQIIATRVNIELSKNAFKHCDEQHRRLMADPERVESYCPIYRHWLDDSADWHPIETYKRDPQFDPVASAKFDLEAFGFLNGLDVVKDWSTANFQLENVPSVDHPEFQRLVRDLEFHVNLQKQRRIQSVDSRNNPGNDSPKLASTRTHSNISLEELETNTPSLDIKSVEWIAARKENSKKLFLPLKTLREYRAAGKGGRKLPNNMFGVDGSGRIWRRQGTRTSTVYYLASSIPKSVDSTVESTV
ncbi:MAG: hypothetical protein Q8M16_02580 [Pirellulaceae bacterium]|nr:hypothetical protein [Pirellulaceae bacterium]